MISGFNVTPQRRSWLQEAALLLVVAFAILMALATLNGAQAARLVAFDAGYEPGTIVIRAGERGLYLTLPGAQAIRYPVAVGKPGHGWRGWARIDGKYVRPAWSPPAEVKRDIPSLPSVIPGGAPGNPMGARALTLDRDEIAIHGTNAKMRRSVGTAASYGCIRMYDEDVIDLYERVAVGTPVLMLP